MIISEEMWQKFKRLKQEILDLKQIKQASCASKYFVYTYTPSTDSSNYLVTYKSGEQPIITEVLSDGSVSLSAPSDDTQYLFFFAHYPATITLYSTREIESIETA